MAETEDAAFTGLSSASEAVARDAALVAASTADSLSIDTSFAPRRAAEGKNQDGKPAKGSSAPAANASLSVAILDTPVAVPALEKRVFDSWEEFHAYLQAYSRSTFQIYSVRSATPSARRNELMARKRPSETQLLIPPQFAHYVKTLACTHGGKPRRRGTGLRPNHHHRAIQCPAQLNACVKRDGSVWQVHVTNQHAWHNHEVSEELYRSYPVVRNALDDDVLATVNILRKAEANRKKILEYIIENTSQSPKMKDVHNLLSKMKREEQEKGVV
ncbi:unnamed protein product [Phytophthora lilii]|uniref:Unnamed protein product n=1 Tax=Phytophthora lilii TaxID=2077276 RepID=A0A9W6WN27_9STRA|nr:unnamed protein product [Phytophthora lilii]